MDKNLQILSIAATVAVGVATIIVMIIISQDPSDEIPDIHKVDQEQQIVGIEPVATKSEKTIDDYARELELLQKELEKTKEKNSQDSVVITELEKQIERLHIVIDILTEANEAYDKGNSIEAISLYNAYLEESPEDTDVKLILANEYLRSQQYTDAIRYYLQILEDPYFENNADVLNNIGLAYFHVKDLEDSETYLKQALRYEPDNHVILNNNGVLENSKNNLIKAADFFENALKIKEEFVAAKNNLLVVQLFQGKNLSEINERFDEILEDNPDNILLKNNSSTLKEAELKGLDIEHYSVNHYQGDDEFSSPELVSTNENYGNVGFLIDTASKVKEQADFRLAIHYFEESLDIDDDNSEVYNHLGEAYLEIEQYARSQENYQKSKELEPNDVNAMIGIATAKTHQSHLTEEAVMEFQDIIRLHPEKVNAIIGLGNANLELGHYESAKVECEKAQSLTQNNVNAYKCLGRAFFGLGEIDEAQTNFEKALEQNPSDIDILFALHKIGFANKDVEEMNRLLAKIENQKSTQNLNLIKLAEDYLSEGHIEISINILNSVLEKDPQNKFALELLNSISK